MKPELFTQRKTDGSLFQRIRARSPLSSPRFWKWALVLLGVAVVFDFVNAATPNAIIARNAVLAEMRESIVAADGNAETAPPANGKSKNGKNDHADHTKQADDHADEGHSGGHADPVAPVLLDIILILFLAKTVGDLFERMGMPAVLGELAVGIVLGNLGLLGIDALDPYFKLPDLQSQQFISEFIADPEHVAYHPAIMLKILAGIGVILLLFEVGLESTVREMLSVGTSSLLVALLGVVAPIGLGWWVGVMLLPEAGWPVHAFIGATLCATSVGITARVLKDLGRSQQRESQIILGAAVIDDVLGLVVLAVVTGVINKLAAGGAAAGDLSSVLWSTAEIVGKAFAFLFGAIVLGSFFLARPLFKAASFLRGHGLLVATALVICFGFSWLANQMGLATIVGAFAAGLILERTHYRELGRKEDHTLEEALAPLTAMLVPIFFVQMGTQVELSSFGDSDVWLLAGAMTLMAIIGKQVCSLGVLEKGLNKFAVGLGMIPRGEVGLIFAAEGAKLSIEGERVISADTYSAIVVMVMITTMVTPPLLKWSLLRGGGGDDAPATDSPASEESAAEER